MDKQSPVEGVQSGGRLIQRPGSKAQFGKGLEWTRRLEREQECSTPEARFVGRWSRCDHGSFPSGKRSEAVPRSLSTRAGPGPQPVFRATNGRAADPEIGIVLPLGIADDDRRRARKEARGVHPVVLQLPIR